MRKSVRETVLRSAGEDGSCQDRTECDRELVGVVSDRTLVETGQGRDWRRPDNRGTTKRRTNRTRTLTRQDKIWQDRTGRDSKWCYWTENVKVGQIKKDRVVTRQHNPVVQMGRAQ